MKFTHIHKPTGKPCAIISVTQFAAVINLGEDVSNPFPRVDKEDLEPIPEGHHSFAVGGYTDTVSDGGMDPRDAKALAESIKLDQAYCTNDTSLAEQFDADLVALVRAVREALVDLTPEPGGKEWPSTAKLREALEQFEPWLEQDEDPRSMGWVDDRGRP